MQRAKKGFLTFIKVLKEGFFNVKNVKFPWGNLCENKWHQSIEELLEIPTVRETLNKNSLMASIICENCEKVFDLWTQYDKKNLKSFLEKGEEKWWIECIDQGHSLLLEKLLAFMQKEDSQQVRKSLVAIKRAIQQDKTGEMFFLFIKYQGRIKTIDVLSILISSYQYLNWNVAQFLMDQYGATLKEYEKKELLLWCTNPERKKGWALLSQTGYGIKNADALILDYMCNQKNDQMWEEFFKETQGKWTESQKVWIKNQALNQVISTKIPSMLEILLKYAGEIIKEKEGPLPRVVSSEQTEMIENLLKEGIRLNEEAILSQAIQEKQDQTVKVILMSGVSLKKVNQEGEILGERLLREAINQQVSSIILLLIEHETSLLESSSLKYTIFSKGSSESVEALLENQTIQQIVKDNPKRVLSELLKGPTLLEEKVCETILHLIPIEMWEKKEDNDDCRLPLLKVLEEGQYHLAQAILKNVKQELDLIEKKEAIPMMMKACVDKKVRGVESEWVELIHLLYERGANLKNERQPNLIGGEVMEKIKDRDILYKTNEEGEMKGLFKMKIELEKCESPLYRSYRYQNRGERVYQQYC